MFRLLSVSFVVLVLLVLGRLVVWLFGVSEFVSSCRGLLSGLLCRRFLEFWFRAGGGCFVVNSVVLYSSLFSCWLFWWWMIWCFIVGVSCYWGDWLFRVCWGCCLFGCFGFGGFGVGDCVLVLGLELLSYGFIRLSAGLGLLCIVVRRRFACLGLRCGFWVCFIWGFLRLGLLVGLG